MAQIQQPKTGLGSVEETNRLLGGNYFNKDTGQAIQPFVPKPMNTTGFNPSSPVSAPNLKNNGSTYNPPAPNKTYQTTVGVNALAESEPMKPPVVNEKEIQRQSLYDKVMQGSADVVAQKAQAREDADIQARQDAYNKELAGYKNRKNAYEDEIEKLEKNPRGMLASALQSEVDDLRRKANKDLAYMAVNVELAQNNYTGAEKILNDRIADIQTDYDNELKKFQIAQDFLQNDLSESEKLQANQAFEKEQQQTKFELDQLSADRDAIRQQADPLYKARLNSEYLSQTKTRLENDANLPGVVSAKAQSEALTNMSLVDELLAGDKFKNVVGINRLNPLRPLFGKSQYSVNQFNQLKGNLSLENREKLKGSGAVSDFEFKILGQASSALGQNLDNASAERELKKIRGVFANAAGLPATVKITDPASGKSVVVSATRETINQALIDGANIEYR